MPENQSINADIYGIYQSKRTLTPISSNAVFKA